MASSKVKVTTGEVPFDVPGAGKECKTWYTVFGDLSSSSPSSPSNSRPLVILHGGPGACHNYMLPLQDLAAAPYHIPAVILYDQLGNGHSTHLRDKRLDTSFWTVDLFMAELDNLLSHLKIADDYDLLGQSWGGMLGSMWAMADPAKYKGIKGMKRLIISNSPASMELWVEACNELRKSLPAEIEETLKKHEKDGTYEDPAYEKAVLFFYKRHLCRVVPFPQCVTDSLDWIKEDDTVYFTM